MSVEKMIAENQDWINSTWEKLDKKLSHTAVKSRNKIPHTTRNGEHDDHSHGKDTIMWTNGFWGGLMWLMYSETKKDCYKQTAEISEKLMDQAFGYMEEWNHDVGFMWHILSGAHYKLTGDLNSRNRNLIAAMSLMSRYNVEGDYIRCWNSWITGEDVSGWTIVDCLMNLPLLYWASEELKDSRFKKVAIRYANMAIRDHVRADGSVYHIVIHDTENPGVVLGTNVGQAYSKDSSWARGTAWAVYGFVLSYMHTRDVKYLDAAKKIGNYFIKNVKGINFPSNMLYSAMLKCAGELYADESLLVQAEYVKQQVVKYAFNGRLFVDNAEVVEGKIVPFTDHISETCQYYALFFHIMEDENYAMFIKENFGPNRKAGFDYVGKSNVFIGNYLRLFWLDEQKEYDMVLSESVEYFYEMSKKTGTLWEHDQAQASCNHGFASVIATLLLRAKSYGIVDFIR